MADITGMLQAAAGNAGEEADPYFQNTVLLLHGDGNQGANNFYNAGDPVYLAFKDNSSNNFPITVNGDAYGDNFGPYALDDGYWSNYFDGSGDYLKTPSSSAFNWASGNFTIEGWFYATAPGSSEHIFASYIDASNRESLYMSDATTLNWWVNGSARISATIAANTWYHFAIVNNSGTTTFYLNGVSAGTWASSYTSGNRLIWIATYNDAGFGPDSFTGYVSNVRVVSSAVYTSGFTPPTSPLTAISGTSLLTCQSNRFVDNSTNNFAITPAGNVAVKVFNPFNELPDGVNGSGYFGGDTDYITGTSNAAYQFNTGDFTVECWLYTTALVGSAAKIFQYATDGNFSSGGYGLEQTSVSNLTWGRSTGTVTLSTSVPVNEWFHFAIVRSSGTLTAYINGTSVYSAADSYNYNYGGAWPFSIGSGRDGSGTFNNDYTGFISNFRVVKGTAVYTTAFTPPASPLTAVTNTSLLTCQYAGTVRNVGFIDSGPYDWPITRVGNTTQGTFSPFSKPDGRWGNYFDGSGDYLDTPTNQISLDVTQGDFTIEAWVYRNASGAEHYICSQRGAGSGYELRINSNNTLQGFYTSGSSITSTGTVPANQWVHICWVRSSSTASLYINGTRDGTGSFSNGSSAYTAYALRIGYTTAPPAGYMNGYVSNFRLVKGSAVYDPTSTTLTVPTSPLTAVSGTSLLTCQSNRFVDNSTNNFAITANGNVKVTPFSPFPITTEYSPSVNGGAAYFDGSDTLDFPNNAVFAFGTGAFTIDFWIYAPLNSDSFILEGRNAIGTMHITCGGFASTAGVLRYVGSSTVLSSNVITDNSWHHCAVVRDGSNNITLYVDGVSRGTGTDTTNYTTTTGTFNGIGGRTGVGNFLTGYLSSFRIQKGVAIDFSSVGVPTAPSTLGANTSLLCNFTNAGIFDNTGFNVLETVGNAQIDTTTKKYGTGAMKFDGTGDYLQLSDRTNFDFGTGDFTIECWVYLATSPTTAPYTIIEARSFDVLNEYSVDISATSKLDFIYSASRVTSATSVSATTWVHVAVTRSSGTIRLFIDGVLDANTASYSSGINTAAPVVIGGGRSGGTSAITGYYFNGYIDDLRITKGVARYTTTFTPPDKAFPNIGA